MTFGATFHLSRKAAGVSRRWITAGDSQSFFSAFDKVLKEESLFQALVIRKLRHFSVATLRISTTTTLKVKLEKCTEHIRQFWSLCQTMICIMWIFSWDLRPPYDNSSQMTVSRLHGNYSHFRHFGHPSSIAETAVQLALTFCWPSFS